MLSYVIHGVSVTAILDTRRTNADNSYSVRIRVGHNRKTKFISTGKTCSKQFWEKLPTGKTAQIAEFRNDVQTSFELVKQCVIQLVTDNRFSFERLDQSLQRSSGTFLRELLEWKIDQCKASGQVGTKKSYQNTLSHLKKYKKKDIAIEDITVEWLNSFERFLLQNRSVSTVGINMRNIRTIMNIAKSRGLIKYEDYPFGNGKFMIKTQSGVKKALSAQQIDSIKKFYSPLENLMKARDLWLFIYYCNGINIADLINLKFSKIIDDEIHFIREKTKRTTKEVKVIRASLTKEMRAIIERWGNVPQSDNYIFDLVEHCEDPEIMHKRKTSFTKYFNNQLKLIGAHLGIHQISSYHARHSFATTLKRKNVNVVFIQEALGHTSLNTTQVYLDSFGQEERQKNAALL